MGEVRGKLLLKIGHDVEVAISISWHTIFEDGNLSPLTHYHPHTLLAFASDLG